MTPGDFDGTPWPSLLLTVLLGIVLPKVARLVHRA